MDVKAMEESLVSHVSIAARALLFLPGAELLVPRRYLAQRTMSM